jgi:hypothetical protein
VSVSDGFDDCELRWKRGVIEANGIFGFLLIPPERLKGLQDAEMTVQNQPKRLDQCANSSWKITF